MVSFLLIHFLKVSFIDFALSTNDLTASTIKVFNTITEVNTINVVPINCLTMGF